jgi:hypothetical protein
MVQLANTTFRGERSPSVLQRRRGVMLPAVKPGVNGPRAGSDQRQGYGPDGQYRAIPDMGGRREGDPHFSAPGDNSGQRRPKTGDEQQAGEASDHLRHLKSVTGRCHRAVQQSTANQQSLDQQPGAWRTLRERGEQPLHMYPVFSLRDGQRI